MPVLRRRIVAFVTSVLFLTLWSATSAPAEPAADLPSSFQWSSSGPLVSPHPDADHDILSVKDPSVVRANGKWHLFMTTATRGDGDWSLAYTSFRNWSQADEATQHHLETVSNVGPGFRAAPQIFYFAPQETWYLIYQTGLPTYVTTKDISDPTSWSEPKNFQDEMPPIIQENIGNGFWLDFWVTCDDTMCYLYSSDDNGQLYRAETTVADFPNGFSNTRIEMQDDRFDLFEAANIYKLGNSDEYLLIVEAIGAEGRRYFRSWTANGLNGEWTPLADTEANPFAGAANVSFPNGGRWTEDISHGEMIRAGIDQTMEINPCRLQYLYQGMDPSSSGEYSQLPWRLALLTQQNSNC